MARLHVACQSGVRPVAEAAADSVFLIFRDPCAPTLAAESFAALEPAEARALAASLVAAADAVALAAAEAARAAA